MSERGKPRTARSLCILTAHLSKHRNALSPRSITLTDMVGIFYAAMVAHLISTGGMGDNNDLIPTSDWLSCRGGRGLNMAAVTHALHLSPLFNVSPGLFIVPESLLNNINVRGAVKRPAFSKLITDPSCVLFRAS